MKKRITLVISLAFVIICAFFQSRFPVQATDTFHFNTVFEENNPKQTKYNSEERIDFSEDYYIETEKKELCKAVLEDDFEDNIVVVLISHDVSMNFKNYTIEDFPELNLVSIQNKTFDTTIALQEEISGLKRDKYDELAKRIVDNNIELQINDNESSADKAQRMAITAVEARNPYFHQVYYLTLEGHSKEKVLESIKLLEMRDDIFAAEPHYYLNTTVCITPNDSNYNYQWAPNNMYLPSAWEITTGSSTVKVGIIDSGILGNHPDLINNINVTLSKSFKENSSAFVDDINHGTHVAGIIGARGNNMQGVAGVNWYVSLVSLKNDFGDNFIDDFINAISYSDQHHIEILNCSFSVSGSTNELYNAIKNYQGILVCSAGNEGKNIDDFSQPVFRYPSRYDLDNIISVAGIRSSNQLFDNGNGQSNYGPTSVDIAAPGQNIYSTINNGSYYSFDGTSMAAPQVSGVAALIKSVRPNISVLGLRKTILDTVTPVTYLNNKVVTGGKVNAFAALIAAQNPSSYTIHYRRNGGMGLSMPDSSITYGDKAQLSINTYFYREGYKFAGWIAMNSLGQRAYLKSDGSMEWCVQGQQSEGSILKVFKDGATDRDGVSMLTEDDNDEIFLYAQWEPISYTISYNMGEGESGFMPSQIARYDTSIRLSDCTYTYNGYTFVGWKVYRFQNDHFEWLYTNTNNTVKEWYSEGSEPTNYFKVHYKDKAIVENLTSIDHQYIYMCAQWGIKGDVDMDEEISIMDATKIQRYLCDLETFNYQQTILADFDCDGDITIMDVLAIQNYISDL